VEEFKYLGTTLTNKNSIQEEIKSRLKLLLLLVIIQYRNLCLPVKDQDMRAVHKGTEHLK